ncbi:MAG: tetratricopeptide repeat protein [Syntrophales bacterium]|jgi:tetratricopeptide (TPR) repeat protein|nr:tetratricopeptide repeat protein [Syntrophales bacterium]
MARQNKQQIQTQTKEAPRLAPNEMAARLFLTGFVCLCIGVGIGYFFGSQSGGISIPGSSAPFRAQTSPASPNQPPAQNPAIAAQNEASLRALLMANPKNLDALIQLGNLYYDQGQHQQAVEWYGKALEIDPSNANVRTDRGTSYWSLNQPDAAIAEFKKSLQVDPNHLQTLYNIGLVYLQGKNNSAEAKKAWQKLLTVSPNYPNRADIEQQLAAMAAAPPAGAPIAPKKARP